MDVSDAVVLFLGATGGGRCRAAGLCGRLVIGCVSPGMGGTPADSRCAGNSDEPQGSG